MKIYNEKEQGEQGKIQNAQFEGKRSTRKWKGASSLNPIFKEINRLRNGIKDVVGIHSANSLLDTCPLGHGLRYNKRTDKDR